MAGNIFLCVTPSLPTMLCQRDIIGLFLVYSYVALVVSVAMVAKRRYPGCSYRKIVHILVGNIVFIWWVFEDRWVMGLLAALPFVFILLLATQRSPFQRLNGSFLGMATAQGHDLGLVYYAISWTVLAILLFDHRMAASIAIVAMSYGDGIGGLVGKRWGKRRLYDNKTYLGTGAVFVGTALITLIVMLFYNMLSGPMPQLNIPAIDSLCTVAIALLAGTFVATVELVTPGEYDNLIVPMSTAALMLLVGL